jgi:hypothetical protein
MISEGIEFAIRAGLGRKEWVATIHFPDASEPLARSSMVQVTENPRRSNRADAGPHSHWQKWQKLKHAPPPNLTQMNCAALFAACLLQPTDPVYIVHPAVVTDANPSAS